MYKLKPTMSWHSLTAHLMKNVGLTNDRDAFVWLRSHAGSTEVAHAPQTASQYRQDVKQLDRNDTKKV